MNKTGIEDLIAMNALYRPGPEKFIPDFIEGKRMHLRLNIYVLN